MSRQSYVKFLVIEFAQLSTMLPIYQSTMIIRVILRPWSVQFLQFLSNSVYRSKTLNYSHLFHPSELLSPYEEL